MMRNVLGQKVMNVIGAGPKIDAYSRETGLKRGEEEA
jgi:hypothetical protein